MGVTKLRGRQTRASEQYNPSGTGLASDSEVEARVRQHSSLFHHNRNDYTKLYFDTSGNLTDIKTFSDAIETLLLAHTAFTFLNGNLNTIDKKVYNENGIGLYLNTIQTFNFDVNGNLTSIDNKKIV